MGAPRGRILALVCPGVKDLRGLGWPVTCAEERKFPAFRRKRWSSLVRGLRFPPRRPCPVWPRSTSSGCNGTRCARLWNAPTRSPCPQMDRCGRQAEDQGAPDGVPGRGAVSGERHQADLRFPRSGPFDEVLPAQGQAPPLPDPCRIMAAPVGFGVFFGSLFVPAFATGGIREGGHGWRPFRGWTGAGIAAPHIVYDRARVANHRNALRNVLQPTERELSS